MENKLESNINNCPVKIENAIYQVSLLQEMAYGDYKGYVTIKELKEHGDIGIGTFNALNGELIMIDKVVYRALYNGSIEIVSEDETTPFAVVATMNSDKTKFLENITDLSSLYKELDRLIEEKGKNRFYTIRIDGLFKEVNVRSVPAQTEPYKRLVEVLNEQQVLFDYENTEGTVVGFYCPPYMSNLNAIGWHMHFISNDRTKGGHLMKLNIHEAFLTWDNIDSFQLKLPGSERFDSFDLTVDQSKDIEKIEKNNS